MADPTSDAFLNGEGIPVPLGDIDAELTRLWGPAAEREGGPDLDHPTVTRLALANLVLADLLSDGARTRQILEGIASRYPSRMIVLRPAGDDGRSVAAEVSAVCHLPAPGMPQICAERIVLRVGAAGLDLLPGAIRPLLETNLPLVLWWAGDPRPHHALFRDLADESARLILDLPDPDCDPDAVAFALDLRVNRYGRDLAWFGITPWRERVAHFFDPPGAAKALDALRRVEIDAAAPRTSTKTPRVALWLASWLAGQLGWTPTARPLAPDADAPATFDTGHGPVELIFRTARSDDVTQAHLTGVRLDAGTAGQFQVARIDQSDEVQVEAHAAGSCALPRLVRSPEWDDAHRLAAALESARDDPPYRQALPHLLWLLGTGPATPTAS